MNLTNILFEPYVIIIIISIIITSVAYFVIQNDNKNKEEEEKINVGTSLLYTFIGSFVLMMLIKIGISYMSKNNMFQKGGVLPVVNENEITDKLTIIADDVDYGLFEGN
jgi:uncharacterized membrane protein YdjX (TVP38/TMEM64 family)